MVAELAHEYPPKIKYIVIPKRRLVQSSHSTSNPYSSYSPYSTPFDSNTNNNHNHSSSNSYETQQHIRNRYLMLLEREKNRTERSPSPPRTSTLTLPSSSASRLSTIFREASGGFPAVPLSSSYRNPLRIIAIDRDRDNGLTPSMTSRKVESDNRNSSRLGSIESNVESLLRKRRLGEYDESARVGESDKLREDSETKRFREESERLAGLIDFIRRRDDSLAAIARGSVSIVDDDSDSEDDEEENDPLKSEVLKYESEWAVDTFVHSDDEDEDEEEEDEDEESDAIPYSIAKPSSTLLANPDQQTEESGSSGSELNEESETVDRRNTKQIYRSHVDDNSDSESDEGR